MNMKRIVVAGTITALLLGLAGTGTALVRMHGKVCALEQERAQLAQKVEEEFFRKKDHGDEEPANADVSAAVKILYNNPALASLLLGFRTA